MGFRGKKKAIFGMHKLIVNIFDKHGDIAVKMKTILCEKNS